MYPTPPVILYRYKSQIRAKMVCCGHVWVEDAHSSFFSNFYVRDRLLCLVKDLLFYTLQSHFQRRNVTDLSRFKQVYKGKCWNKFHSLLLVPSVRSFPTRSHYATSTGSNRPHFLCIPVVKRNFGTDGFFLTTATLWNKIQYGSFVDHWQFKSRANTDLFYSFSLYSVPPSSS